MLRWASARQFDGRDRPLGNSGAVRMSRKCPSRAGDAPHYQDPGKLCSPQPPGAPPHSASPTWLCSDGAGGRRKLKTGVHRKAVQVFVAKIAVVRDRAANPPRPRQPKDGEQLLIPSEPVCRRFGAGSATNRPRNGLVPGHSRLHTYTQPKK